jgi:DNA-binding NarL/FixJ family response regulator
MSARYIRTIGTYGPAAKAERRRPVAGSALLSEEKWAETARLLRLSGRELEIVRGVFDNRTEHAIAADYGIADCTVHTHLDRLYHKLAVTTRVELVLRVIEGVLHSNPPPSSGTETRTSTASDSQLMQPGVL